MRAILYARCSTAKDQKPELQLEILRDYSKNRGFIISNEIIDTGFSGATDQRPGLKELLKLARSRQVDVVIVLKLDRLFRSLRHLTNTLDEFDSLKISFVSINDQIDMTTASGRLMMQIVGAFSEFEISLIRERTILGLEHARRKGKKLGRPAAKPEIIQKILELRSQGLPYHKIQTQLKVSKGLISGAIHSARKMKPEITDYEQKRTGG